MYIESLHLNNYRNYNELSIDLDSGTNIFYGNNAQGKTNVLESIYLCGTTKSHRGSKDKEVIKFNEEESHIRMFVNKNEMKYKIDMHIRKSKAKTAAINGIPVKKARELFGILNMVFFSPEDLNIIKNSPLERRRFLDMELCQLDALYLTDLSCYNHLINQRNKLLKEIKINYSLIDTLEIWDKQLFSYGIKIIEKRRKFVTELNNIIKTIHNELTDGKEKIDIVYKPNTYEENFYENLRLSKEKDLILKTTSVGPHRDDLVFFINEVDVKKYGSQGQQRTAALSLKLAEIELVKKRINDTPILLLDDVLSELDRSRQNCLMKCIHDVQTLITCTGIDDFLKSQIPYNKIFFVREGSIEVHSL